MNKELFKLINERIDFLTQYCKKRNQIDAEYHKAKIILQTIQNAPFKPEYLAYFQGKTKTIALRNICREFGFDYWESLHLSNSINRLDSISCQINAKKNGIKY